MYLRGRASVHGAMGRRINPSRWTHSAIPLPVTGRDTSYPVYEPLLLIAKSGLCRGGFLSRYLSGPLPYT